MLSTAETAEKNAERDLTYSYNEYVDVLVARLQITADTDRLYADSAMDLKPWLDAIQLPKDTKPVDASFPIGPSSIYKPGTSTAHLRSDDALPKNAVELKYGQKRLAAYALAEAKLRFLEKKFEDLPALRGFTLQSGIAGIRSEVNFYEHNAYWQEKKPLRKKIYAAIGALGLAAIACGFNFGTGEIPTAPPTVAGEVQPAGTEFYLINEEAARQAILAWNGKELGPGYTLYDVDGDGQIEWARFLNGLDVVDINKNPPMPAGSMSVAILETMGPDGGAYSFMLLDNMGMGARAMVATNALVNPDGTITSDLIDANGILRAHLVVNTIHEEGKAWATIVYTEPDSDSLLPSYDLFSTIDTLQFETALSGGKPLFSVMPASLTPTADVPPTPAETPDPMLGAPDGATEKINGEWVMKKDGKIYKQKTIQIGKESLTYWSTSLVENGSMNGGSSIPLEFNGSPRSGSDTMPWSVLVKAGVVGVPIFRQVDNFSNTSSSLHRALWGVLVRNQAYDLSASQLFEALTNENSPNRSKVAANFTTPDGVIHTWLFNQGYEFTWVSWEDMEKFPHWETTDETDGKSIVFRWTVTTDADGTLRAIGAVEHPELLNPEQVFKLVLGPMYKALTNETKFKFEDSIYWGTMVDILSDGAPSIVDLRFTPSPAPAATPAGMP